MYDDLLAKTDLTEQKPHCIHQMSERVIHALHQYPMLVECKGDRVVSSEDNYNLLGYSRNDVTQSLRYTKWVDETHLLRTQTTSIIVGGLKEHSKNNTPVTLISRGMVYRRDVRDKKHCGEPHQMDIWVVHRKSEIYPLNDLIKTVMSQHHHLYQTKTTEHPYTLMGQEMEAMWGTEWLEVGECGVIAPHVLERTGWNQDEWTGLAMGIGLDRMVMIKKELPDIRLLRDDRPNISQQMQNLLLWKEVSNQPGARRQLSVLRDKNETEEDITELVMAACAQPLLIEHVGVQVLDIRTLPEIARVRLGGNKGYNVVLDIVLRDLSQSLARNDVNLMMREIYQGLHQGTAWIYCP